MSTSTEPQRQDYKFTVTVRTKATFREAQMDRELARNLLRRNLPWTTGVKVSKTQRDIPTRKPKKAPAPPKEEGD